MSDWINNLKKEDEQRMREEKNRQLIAQRFSGDIKNHLLNVAKQTADALNKDIFKRNDYIKVKERYNGKHENDFCVFCDVLPAAFLFVNFYFHDARISRKLTTTNDQPLPAHRSQDETLPDLGIGLKVDNTPFVHLNGRRLNDKEIGEMLVAPVVNHVRNYQR